MRSNGADARTAIDSSWHEFRLEKIACTLNAQTGKDAEI